MKSKKLLRGFAAELYNSGTTNPIDVSKELFNTYGYEAGENALYQAVRRWLKKLEDQEQHPALFN